MTAPDLTVKVYNDLLARNLTIATAESLTGGLLCATLVEVPGSSAVVRGGIISYATDLKASLLGVPAELLAARGAVDPDVAVAMADGVRARTGADIGVATTGVAGPDPQDGVPPGVVYLAITGAVTALQRHEFAGSRNAIREASVVAMLRLLDAGLAQLDC